MNAPVLLAQLQGTTATSSSSPRHIKLEKPPGGATITVNLQGANQLDFSDIASEKLTFVRVGDKLIILFDNQSTVTINPLFGSDGHPLADISFEMAPDHMLNGEQFASQFPITTDQSILPAAGAGSGPVSGAHFSDPSVDPLSIGNPLPLLGPEGFGTSSSAFTETAANASPSAGPIGAVILNEDGLPGGNPGGPGDVGGIATTFTGGLNIDFGTALVGRSLSFASTQSTFDNLTSGGQPVHFEITTVGGQPTLIAYVGTDPTIVANEVLTISLDANSTLHGQFTVTLMRPLDDPIHGTEDTLDLKIGVIATNGAGATTTTTIEIDVNDDSPIINVANETHSTITDPATFLHSTATGLLGISWGADNFNTSVDGGVSATTGGNGDRSVIFADTNVIATGSAANGDNTVVTPITGLTSDNQAVHYVLLDNGTVLVGYTGNTAPTTAPVSSGEGESEVPSNIVFVVSLSDASNTGSYTVTQYQPLDHIADGTRFDSINLTFNFTATDSDGDPVTGALTMTVNDTVPAIIGTTTPETVHEDGLPTGNHLPGESQIITVTTSLDVNWGADNETVQPGSSFGRTLSFLAGDDATAIAASTTPVTSLAMTISGEQGTSLTSEGIALVYVVSSNGNGGETLTATQGAGGPTVFTLSLDPTAANGAYTFTLDGPLDHAAGSDSIGLIFTVQAADADGDTINQTFAVSVQDDIPVLTGLVADNTVGEEGLTGANSLPNMVHTATTGVVSLDIGWGADDNNSGATNNRSVVFDSSTVGTLQGMHLTSDGHPLSYVITTDSSGQQLLTASANGHSVFTVQLSDSGSGSYDFTLLGNLDHPAAQGANGIAFNFSVNATDDDGDSVNQVFTVDVQDDVPVANTGTPESVKEANLLFGSSPDLFDLSVTGSLNVAWGADSNNSGSTNNRSVSFTNSSASADVTVSDGTNPVTLTSDGHTVQFGIFNGVLVGYINNDPVFEKVFTVSLSDTNNGSYTFTLLGNLDHTGVQGNNDLLLTFAYTAKDSDGDTSSNQFTVTVVDDVPTAHGGDATQVNEANLQSGNAPLPFHLPVAAIGDLNITWGADNNNSGSTNNRSVSFTDLNVGVTTGSGVNTTAVSGGLFSDGHQLSYAVNNGVLTGSYVDSSNVTHDVFTVSLSDILNGFYTFTLIGNLDHPAGQGTNLLNLTFDYTATDSDGDTSASTFTVTVKDSVPVTSGNVGDESVYEGGLTGGNATGGTTTSITEALNINWGADNATHPDDASGRTLSFLASDKSTALGAGTPSSLALLITGEQGTALTSGGTALVYTVAVDADGGETLTAHLGSSSGAAIFTLALDPTQTHGGYVFTLMGPLDDASGSNNIALTFTVQATDSDGDSVNTVFTVDVHDDVPVANTGMPETVYEANLLFGSSPDLPDLQQTGSLNISWGADNHNSGSTNNRSVSFTNSSASADVTVSDGTNPVTLTSDGHTVQFGIFNGVLVGYINNDPVFEKVFTVSLSDTNNGSYTFTLLGNLDHTGVQGNNDLLLTFAYTATDADGDSANNSFTVTVVDDVPTAHGGDATQVDEANLPSGNAPLFFGLLDPSVTGGLHITWGADNNNSGSTNNRSVTFTDAVVGVTTGSGANPTAVSGGLFSDGHQLSYAVNGGTLTGYYVDSSSHTHNVFTVSLDDNFSGSYTFTLLGTLDDPTAHGTAPLNLTFDYTATDSDGDTSSSTFTVSVQDSVPLAFGASNAHVDEDDLPSGTSPHASALADTESLHIGWGSDDAIRSATSSFGRTLSFLAGDNSTALSDGAVSSLAMSITGEHGNVLSSGGVALVYTVTTNVNGGETLAAFAGTTSGPEIFTLTLDPTSSNGSYTFTLMGPLDDASNSNSIGLKFTVQAADADGDPVNTSFTVSVTDDQPTVTGNVSPETVSEGGLTGGNVSGAAFTPVEALNINWGADNATQPGDTSGRTLSFLTTGNHVVTGGANAVTGLEMVVTGAQSNSALTSGGVALVYVVTANTNGGETLTAYAGTTNGPEIFTLALDPTQTHGGYVFTLMGPLDDATNSNSIGLKFTVHAADADGDTVNTSFTVNVTDDQPVVSGNVTNGTVLEGGLTGGNSSGAATFTPTEALNINWGADSATHPGDASGRKLSFLTTGDHVVAGGANAVTGLEMTVSGAQNNSALTSGGATLFYTVAANSNGGETLTAHAGSATGAAVFTLTLDPTQPHGGYVFNLLGTLDDASNSNSIGLTFTVQAADADGDPVKTSFTVNVTDDTPVTPASASMTILEHGLVSASDISVTSSNAALAPGADGFAGGSLANAIHFTALPTGLTIDNGTAVTVTQNGATVTGMAGSTVVFTLTVAADGTYTYDQKVALHHPNPGADNDALNFAFTITDGDGDVSAAATVTVNVTDDVPTISVSGTAITADETPDVQAGTNDVALASAPAALPTGFINVAQSAAGYAAIAGGADGVKSVALTGSNGLALANAHSGLFGLDGNEILLTTSATNPNLVLGMEGGHLALALYVDPTTGILTVAEYEAVKNPVTTDPNDPVTMNNVVFVSVTDGDGDVATSSTGLKVTILDDGPTIGAPDSETVQEHTLVVLPVIADSAHGSLAIDFGTDGPAAAGVPANPGTLHTYNFNNGSTNIDPNLTVNAHFGVVNGELGGGQNAPVVITAANGHPFELNSVDLSGGNTSQIIVSGVDVNGHTWTETVSVADVGTLGGPTSTHLDFTNDLTFAGKELTSISFSVGTAPAYVNVDNLAITTGAAPAVPGPVAFSNLVTAINNISIVDDQNNIVQASTLHSHGLQVQYELLDSATLVAYTGSAPTSTSASNVVFSVVLSQDPINNPNGGYTFTLDKPLDDLPASVTDLKFTFGFTATDGDGDTAPGHFSVDVHDDVPTLVAQTPVSIIDGNFIGTTGVDFTTPGSWSQPLGAIDSKGSIEGWTYTTSPFGGASQVQLERVDSGYAGSTSTDGSPMVDLEASPGNIQVSQTISGLALGEHLLISFEIGEANFGNAKLNVLWDNNVVGTYNPQTGLMQIESIAVTGNGTGSDTLTFQEIGVSGDNTGTYLTDVSAQVVAGTVFEGGLNEFLPATIGSFHIVGNDPGAATSASGTLAGLVQFGADGPAMNGAAANGFELVPQNSAGVTAFLQGLHLSSLGSAVDHGTLVGDTLTATAADGHNVFTLTVNGDGTWTFNLLAPLVDSHQGADSITLDFSSLVKAVDFDGNSIGLATGTFSVAVVDDVPVDTGTPVTGAVSESGLPLVQFDAYSLDISFGADGQGGIVTFATDSHGNPIAPAGLTSGGVALSYAIEIQNGEQTLVAFRSDSTADHPVFEVTLNSPVNPTYIFTLYQPLDEHGPGADTIGLNFTVNATDGDGDTVQQSFTVNVTDDVPHPTIASTGTTLTIDETAGIDPGTDDKGTSNVPAIFSHLGTPIETAQSAAAVVSAGGTFGADGEAPGATPVFSLSISSAGVPSGLTATDGHEIFLYQQGALIVGLEGSGAGGTTADPSGAIAFAISLDSTTGVASIAEYTAIHHSDPNDPNESAHPPSIADGVLLASVTYTDGDGDVVTSAPVSIGPQIHFLDDGPTIGSAGNLITNGSFENDIGNLSSGQWSIFHSVEGWTAVTGTNGNVPFELQDGNISGVPQAPGGGNIIVELDSDPTSGNMPNPDPVNNVNTTGHTNAEIVQTVAGTVEGQVYELSFFYSPRPQVEGSDSSSMNVLWNGQVVKTINSTGMQAGWQQIEVFVQGTGTGHDMVAFQATGTENSWGALIDNVSLVPVTAVSEGGLSTANGDYVNGNGAHVPGYIALPNTDGDNNDATATGVLNVNWGADNFDAPDAYSNATGFTQDAGIGRSLTFTNATVAVVGEAGATLTSHGDPVTFAFASGSTTELIGTATDSHGIQREVIDITLSDDGTGAFHVILKDALDHAAGNGENGLGLTFNYTATDSDGDHVNGNFTVSVNDDIPVAGPVAPATVSEDGLPNVSLAVQSLNISFGADGQGHGDLTFATDSQGHPVLPAALSGLTSNGVALSYEIQTLSSGEQQLVAFRPDQGDGTPVFEVTLNSPSNPVSIFTLYQPIDHDGTLALPFTVNATDGDGDVVQQSFTVDITDSGPTIGTSTVGDVSEDGPLTLTNAPLNINFGTDNGAFSGSLLGIAFTDNVVSATGPDGTTAVPLSSYGNAISIGFINGELIGYTGSTEPTSTSDSHIVFTATLNPATSSYDFTLNQPLDHPAPVGTNDSMNLTFDITATDADGSTATGHFTVNVDAAGTIGSIDYNHETTGVFVNLSDNAYTDTTDGQIAQGHTATDLSSGNGHVIGIDQLGTITDATGGSANDILVGSDTANTLNGGGGNDILIGGGGNDTLIGGTGIDTAKYAATLTTASFSYDSADGKWIVNAGATEGTDNLQGVEAVTDGNGHRFLLVGGGSEYTTIQSAINAAQAGDTILIAPGSYTETVAGSGVSSTPFGLYINTPNLTLQGYSSLDGSVIASAAQAEASGPTVISGAQADFGANFLIGTNGSGATIEGLHLAAGPDTYNKLIEITGDNVTIKNDFVDSNYNGVDTGAATIYIDNQGTPINSYLIDGNILNEGIYVANGVGTPGTISATQIISNNEFTGSFDPVTGDGRYDMIAVQGQLPGVAWQPDAAQVPTIEGNTRDNNESPFIFRMSEQNPALMPNAAQVAAIVAANTDANTSYAYVLNPDGTIHTFDHSYLPGDAPYQQLLVANSIDTLDAGFVAGNEIFGDLRPTMASGDTVLVQSVGPTVSDIVVDNLFVEATATSTDLTLTLDPAFSVQKITLEDYAPGQGANVTVTGNDLGDTIIGNSGDNHLTGGGGNDVIVGGFGADTISGLDGNDQIDGGHNLIANGGFNGPEVIVSSPSQPITIAGWTVTPGNNVDVVASNGSLHAQFPAGINMIDTKGMSDGTLSQTINTIVGHTYTVTFLEGTNPDILANTPNTSAGVTVSATGNASQDFVHSAQPGATWSNIEPTLADETYTFTATSTSTTISFAADASATNQYYGALIGQIYVEDSTPAAQHDGADVITDGNGNDVIQGGAGNDTITAGNGNDLLMGGSGDDTIHAGNGTNFIVGGAGDDTLYGGSGTDTFAYTVGDGVDTVIGGSGNETQVVNGIATSETFVVGAIDATHLGVSIGSDAAHAQLAISDTGVQELVINLGTAGDTVVVNGSLDGTGLATHTITINGNAGDDTVDLSQFTSDQDVVFNGAGNGVNGDTAIFGFASTAATYSAVLDGSGNLIGANITYTAGDGQQVTDTITNVEHFQFTDGTLSVGQLFPPSAPAENVSISDTAAADAGTIINGNALAGVTDVDSHTTLSITEVNGSLANVNQPVVGQFGALVLDTNGTYTYTENAGLDALQPGQSGTDTFHFTVTDSNGGVTTTTLSFNATGAADTPVVNSVTATAADTAVQDAGTVIAQGNLITDGGDSDRDTGVTLSVTSFAGIAMTPGGINDGPWHVNPDGSYTYTANAAVDSLLPGQSEVLSPSFTVTSSDGASASSQVNLTIHGAADTPVVNQVLTTANDTAAQDAGTVVQHGNLLTDGGIDTDRDAGATLSVTSFAGHAVTGGGLDFATTYGTIHVNTDGSYTFTGNAALDGLGAGQQAGTLETFTVTSSDGATASSLVQFTINGAADTPVITNSVTTGSEAEHSAISNVVYQVTATDRDNPANLTYSLGSGGDNSLFSISSTGAVTFNSSPDYLTQPHSYSITVNVSENGAIASENVTINVTPVDFNTATLSIVDTNGHPAPVVGDVLHVNLGNDTDGGVNGAVPVQFQWFDNGAPINGAVGSSYMVAAGDVGDTITVHATYTDGKGFQDTAISGATGTVVSGDHPPVITSAAPTVQVIDDYTSTIPAGNVVQNGGFEINPSSMPGWTGAGFYYTPSNAGSPYAHSGSAEAYFVSNSAIGTWATSVTTVAGVHYTLDFWAAEVFSGQNSIAVSWNGQTVLADGDVHALSNYPNASGYTEYSVDVVGTGSASNLVFSINTGFGSLFLDDVSMTATGITPGTEKTNGVITFTDADAADTHTVSVAANNNVGTFTASLGTESSNGSTGTVNWTFSATDAQISAAVGAQQSITETYKVTIDDGHGGVASQNVTVDLTNPDHVPQITSGPQTGAVTENLSLSVNTSQLIQDGGFESGSHNGLGNVWTATTHSGDVLEDQEYPAQAGSQSVTLWTGTDAANDVIKLTQSVASTVAGVPYELTFFVSNQDDFDPNNFIHVLWNNQTVLSLNAIPESGFGHYTEYSATLMGTGTTSTLEFDFQNADGNYAIDSVSLLSLTTPGTEKTTGVITFTDPDVDPHTVSVAPIAGATGYIGTLTAVIGTDSIDGSPGTVNWTYSVSDSAAASLTVGQSLTQTYVVTIDDGHGGVASQDVTITIHGPAPSSLSGSGLDLAAASDSGSSNHDNITNVTLPTVTVTGLNGTAMFVGEKIEIIDTNHNNTVVGSYAVQASDLNGSGKWTSNGGNESIILTTALTPDGGHNLAAVLADTSGVTGVASSSVTVTEDTIAPNTPTGVSYSTSTGKLTWNTATDNTGGSGVDHYLYELDSSVVTSPVGSFTSTTSKSVSYNPSGSATRTAFVESVDVAGNVSSPTRITFMAPAGVSGSPINLALTDYSDHSGLIAATITGLAAGWALSEGTHNADGSWSVLTSDIGSLTVTSPDGYVGALALNVNESWTNAEGTHGTAVIADNVEAYAKGSPIFAWSGDDTLTASVGNDTLVFANKIGTDVVHNFDTMHDKIDLVGFNGFAGFADVQAHLGHDAAGNAVITLADGETITLNGVAAASLNAGDFEFDQTPVTYNTGDMVIGDGALLPLSGIVDNTGTIHVSSTGSETDLELVQHGMMLEGGGSVVLSDSADNVIYGSDPTVTLTNVDNTISGAGHLGDGQMTLVNEGTIIADGSNALDIDTGSNAVVNSGTLEATGSGGLVVHSDLDNSGLLWANGGNITLDGDVSGNGSALISGNATLEVVGAFNGQVQFDDNASGTLKIDNSTDFHGMLSGFGNQDSIDLNNILASTASINYAANAGNTGGILTVTDGNNTANISLSGEYASADFHLATDQTSHVLVQLEQHAQHLAATA